MKSSVNVQYSLGQKIRVSLSIILLQFSFIEKVTPFVAIVEVIRSSVCHALIFEKSRFSSEAE